MITVQLTGLFRVAIGKTWLFGRKRVLVYVEEIVTEYVTNANSEFYPLRRYKQERLIRPADMPYLVRFYG